MGCHILDPAFWSLKLGAAESVQATNTHYEPPVAAETYPRASMVRYRFPARGNGAILVGEKGTIVHKSHGAGGLRLLQKALAADYKQPDKTIPRVADGNHEMDRVRACKDGKPASSTFDYGGALTEMALLGMLAIRMKDRRLEWDSANLRITNDDEANALVNPPYREGWTL